MSNSPVVATRLSPELLALLDSYAAGQNRSRSEVMVEALRLYLAERHAPPRPSAFPASDELLICWKPE